MMNKFLALLMAFLPGFAKADGAKLGSDGVLIRQMLFASQCVLLIHDELDHRLR